VETVFDFSDKEWEELCSRCCTCCFEKIEDDSGNIFFTGTPCRYLDIDTRMCKIYERRFEINPECVKLSPALVEQLPWLHEQCSYIRVLGLSGPFPDFSE
jgi:uncharacterized protein